MYCFACSLSLESAYLSPLDREQVDYFINSIGKIRLIKFQNNIISVNSCNLWLKKYSHS